MQNLKPGSLLRGGTYKIVRFIASGGFGCTYEAQHTMLDNRLAIKEFFVKDFCNRGEDTAQITVGTLSKKGLVDRLRKKFVDEAKALNSLHHPGIVSVIDIFEENGTSYYVMNYIDGQSLSVKVNAGGPMSEAQALKYIRQVAEALKYVHANNRLHLDIKPANIMIDADDNAVLIDFGASKQYDEVNGENTSTLMGKTPGYAPLEQMGNDVVQFYPSTDIYALGATLYKLLTGITPLSANMLASGEELPPLPANVSAATAEAIKRAMSLKRTDRPQTIDEFIALLPAQGQANKAKPAVAAAKISNTVNLNVSQKIPDTENEATEIAGGNGGNGGNGGTTPITPIELPTKPGKKERRSVNVSKGWIAAVVAVIVAAGVAVGGYFAYDRWFYKPDVRSVTIDDFDIETAFGPGRANETYVGNIYDDSGIVTEATDDYYYPEAAEAAADTAVWVGDSTAYDGYYY